MDIITISDLGKKINGTIQWPTLNNATTKFKGFVEGDTIRFEEYEAITGQDEVQIPSNYVGKLTNDGNTLKGKIVTDADDSDSDEADAPTFQLDKIKGLDDDSDSDATKTPVKSENPVKKPEKVENLQPGSKLSGTCFVQHPFSIKITKRKGVTLEGIVKWQNQQCKTKIKGKIENDILTFEEYELFSKSDDAAVTVPMLYTGKLDVGNGVIDGSYGPAVNKSNGTFKIKL